MATTNRSERRPSLAEFAERAVTGWMRGVFQARPGQVKKWEASKQRADIQPLIKLVYQDEEDERQTESEACAFDSAVRFGCPSIQRQHCPVDRCRRRGPIPLDLPVA